MINGVHAMMLNEGKILDALFHEIFIIKGIIFFNKSFACLYEN